MKQKKFEMPHVFVVLMSVFLVIYFLTFLIPKGEYDRVETEAGHMSIVSGSFNYIEHENVSFFDLVQAIPLGMAQAGELIFGGLMIGALYKVLENTGLIMVAITFIKRVFKKKYIADHSDFNDSYCHIYDDHRCHGIESSLYTGGPSVDPENGL